MKLGPENGTLTVRTGKGGAASKAGHNLVLEVQRWQGSLTPDEVTLTADARSLRVVSGSGGISPLGDDEKARDRADDRRGGARGRHIAYRSSAVTARDDGYDVDGELDLLGVSRPLAFALSSTATTSRPRPGQADRLQDQAVLGAVRDPQGRRRRRGHDRRHPPERHQMVELDHAFADRQGRRLQLGRDPRPRPDHPVRRGRQGARARIARPGQGRDQGQDGRDVDDLQGHRRGGREGRGGAPRRAAR